MGMPVVNSFGLSLRQGAVNLMRLFGRPEDAPPARFPAGRVGFAIGDIHGRADLLGQLLDKLEAGAEVEHHEGGHPIVVFLGDYIDRGPDSAAVIDLLLSGRPFGYETHFLRGNHEQAMLDFLDDPLQNLNWINFGGLETLISYGVQPPSLNGAMADEWRAAAAELKAKLPPAHLAFLRNLERFVTFDDYLFVHAGIDPLKTLEEQSDEDLLWIRDRFIKSRRHFTHRVVHGHSITHRPHADERRVGVDTGAYATGILTAARFEGEGVSFLTAEAPGAARRRG